MSTCATVVVFVPEVLYHHKPVWASVFTAAFTAVMSGYCHIFLSTRGAHVLLSTYCCVGQWRSYGPGDSRKRKLLCRLDPLFSSLVRSRCLRPTVLPKCRLGEFGSIETMTATDKLRVFREFVDNAAADVDEDDGGG